MMTIEASKEAKDKVANIMMQLLDRYGSNPKAAEYRAALRFHRHYLKTMNRDEARDGIKKMFSHLNPDLLDVFMEANVRGQ